MPKKKKKMSKAQAAKTIVRENIKIRKLKAKIGERKRTNAVLRRMKAGKPIALKDSARAAQAVAKAKKKKKK